MKTTKNLVLYDIKNDETVKPLKTSKLNLNDLPDEMIYEIGAYFTYIDIVRLRQTNRRMCKLLLSPTDKINSATKACKFSPLNHILSYKHKQYIDEEYEKHKIQLCNNLYTSNVVKFNEDAITHFRKEYTLNEGKHVFGFIASNYKCEISVYDENGNEIASKYEEYTIVHKSEKIFSRIASFTIDTNNTDVIISIRYDSHAIIHYYNKLVVGCICMKYDDFKYARELFNIYTIRGKHIELNHHNRNMRYVINFEYVYSLFDVDKFKKINETSTKTITFKYDTRNGKCFYLNLNYLKEITTLDENKIHTCYYIIDDVEYHTVFMEFQAIFMRIAYTIAIFIYDGSNEINQINKIMNVVGNTPFIKASTIIVNVKFHIVHNLKNSSPSDLTTFNNTINEIYDEQNKK